MKRPTIIAAIAAAVSIAVGAFALTSALATDQQLVLPLPATTAAESTDAAASTDAAPTTAGPSTSAGASTAAGATTAAGAPTTTAAAAAGPTTAAAAAGPVVIDIANFSFVPPDLTVAVGTEVMWTNSDGADHSIISLDGTILSPTMAGGDEYRFTFTQPGVFEYVCGFHTTMAGTVTVTG